MGNFEYIALAVLVAFCVYLFTRSNKISKKFNEINNELIKYQTLDENKIDLDNESYPFNKTLKELEETIEKIVTSYEGYLTTREGFNTKLDDLKNVTSRLNLTLSSNQKRGNWGEIQVEKILEDSGLVKGQNFETQKPMESGKIPDVTLNLPEGQILNLDVKFPLNNYMKYLDVIEKRENSIDESDYDLLDKSASELKNDFLSDVRKRVNEVTKEGYIDPKTIR